MKGKAEERGTEQDMNGSGCTVKGEHCENCGSTSYEDLHTGEDGYTACCNELIAYGSSDCRNHHGEDAR